MAKKLTKKEKGFVNDYVKTGNGTEAAIKNYDVANRETAAVIAAENLTKPKIVKAIADRLPDDLLEERHLELLNKRDLYTYHTEKKNKEGKNEVEIHKIDLGPEVQAVSKGLDMAYKIKGSYAPEKSVTLNFDASATERTRELGDRFVRLFGRRDRPSV